MGKFCLFLFASSYCWAFIIHSLKVADISNGFNIELQNIWQMAFWAQFQRESQVKRGKLWMSFWPKPIILCFSSFASNWPEPRQGGDHRLRSGWNSGAGIFMAKIYFYEIPDIRKMDNDSEKFICILLLARQASLEPGGKFGTYAKFYQHFFVSNKEVIGCSKKLSNLLKNCLSPLVPHEPASVLRTHLSNQIQAKSLYISHKVNSRCNTL